jgi:hypothetical protein
MRLVDAGRNRERNLVAAFFSLQYNKQLLNKNAKYIAIISQTCAHSCGQLSIALCYKRKALVKH